MVPSEAEGQRLDWCLARYIAELSGAEATTALSVGCVFLDRKRVKSGDRAVRAGQLVVVHFGKPLQSALENQTRGPSHRSSVSPTPLFEDDALVVVCKPAGVVSAPTREGDADDLCALLSAARGGARLWVVHRLDRETSGVLVYAKTRDANRALSEVFRKHELLREYDAFVAGSYPVEQETLDVKLRGKRAVSHVSVEARRACLTHLGVRLETGRTHQIRLHLRQRGFPVLGDRQYGHPTSFDPPRLALHARTLEFPHPSSGRMLSFHEPLPRDLENWLGSIEVP